MLAAFDRSMKTRNDSLLQTKVSCFKPSKEKELFTQALKHVFQREVGNNVHPLAGCAI